jgi:hypothetical protein
MPELTCECDGVGASRIEKSRWRERYRFGSEYKAPESHEWNYEKEFERVDDVVSDLRGCYVETEEKGHCKAKNGCAAKNGVYTDKEADGDAPGEFLWGGSETEKREDGQGDTPVEPVVMDGRGSWFDTCGDGFTLVHS